MWSARWRLISLVFALLLGVDWVLGFCTCEKELIYRRCDPNSCNQTNQCSMPKPPNVCSDVFIFDTIYNYLVQMLDCFAQKCLSCTSFNLRLCFSRLKLPSYPRCSSKCRDSDPIKSARCFLRLNAPSSPIVVCAFDGRAWDSNDCDYRKTFDIASIEQSFNCSNAGIDLNLTSPDGPAKGYDRGEPYWKKVKNYSPKTRDSMLPNFLTKHCKCAMPKTASNCDNNCGDRNGYQRFCSLPRFHNGAVGDLMLRLRSEYLPCRENCNAYGHHICVMDWDTCAMDGNNRNEVTCQCQERDYPICGPAYCDFSNLYTFTCIVYERNVSMDAFYDECESLTRDHKNILCDIKNKRTTTSTTTAMTTTTPTIPTLKNKAVCTCISAKYEVSTCRNTSVCSMLANSKECQIDHLLSSAYCNNSETTIADMILEMLQGLDCIKRDQLCNEPSKCSDKDEFHACHHELTSCAMSGAHNIMRGQKIPVHCDCFLDGTQTKVPAGQKVCGRASCHFRIPMLNEEDSNKNYGEITCTLKEDPADNQYCNVSDPEKVFDGIFYQTLGCINESQRLTAISSVAKSDFDLGYHQLFKPSQVECQCQREVYIERNCSSICEIPGADQHTNWRKCVNESMAYVASCGLETEGRLKLAIKNLMDEITMGINCAVTICDLCRYQFHVCSVDILVDTADNLECDCAKPVVGPVICSLHDTENLNRTTVLKCDVYSRSIAEKSASFCTVGDKERFTRELDHQYITCGSSEHRMNQLAFQHTANLIETGALKAIDQGHTTPWVRALIGSLAVLLIFAGIASGCSYVWYRRADKTHN